MRPNQERESEKSDLLLHGEQKWTSVPKLYHLYTSNFLLKIFASFMY